MSEVILIEAAYERKLNPITLLKYLEGNNEWCESKKEAKDWDFVEVVCKKYQNGYALLFCYDLGARDLGTFYLGHFNDGVV